MHESIELKLPIWGLDSHKGQIGKVIVIGGSKEYHGAPILSALGAEAGGADLITMFLPEEHITAAKIHSLNTFLNGFKGEELTKKEEKSILLACKDNDVMVIGNGLGKSSNTKQAIIDLLMKVDMPVVIDADALLPEILEVRSKYKSKSWLLTPHYEEFRRVFGCEPSSKGVQDAAIKHDLTICLKGRVDYIASPNAFYQNKTGVPQMRIGGTGDVLAGIMGAYYSLNMDAFSAAKTAAFLWGRCGEYMMRKNFILSATNMLKYYPRFVSKVVRQAAERARAGNFCDTIVASNMYN
jgi:hydroxyethylthiazole kinase-like uncharacterized protein yjeF